MRIQAVLVCLYFYLMFPTNIIGLWWAVGSPLVMDPNSICRKSRRLAGKQREICRKEPEIVTEAAEGAKLAITECKSQFRYRRWNCTTARRSFRKILRRDTRETAFVCAITAAGVVYTVTQACSMGTLLQCSCDNSVRDITTDGKWEWGGCGDNVHFGHLKSKEFMDARPKRRRGDITTHVRLHNNEAGRLAISTYMRTDCKCHGLSSSCTLKTCYRRMPNFQEIGTRLKLRFDGASKVIGSNDGKGIMPIERTIKPPTKEDLIYAEESPNFCKRSRKYGTTGTKGRQCEPGSIGVGGCDLLCCGRGYTKRILTVQGNCNCKFIWCCKVNCQTCVVQKTIYTCL